MQFRFHIHHHFEGPLTLASAQFQSQLDRLTKALGDANAKITDLTNQLATATAGTATAVAAEDTADTTALQGVLDTAGVPPAA